MQNADKKSFENLEKIKKKKKHFTTDCDWATIWKIFYKSKHTKENLIKCNGVF